MRLIPESLEALRELQTDTGTDSLRLALQETADRARDIAPDLVGISITNREADLTFTLVATDDEAAILDAVQYLDAGPCVEAIAEGRGNTTDAGGLLDEEAWRTLAAAGAHVGVRSTLTFPVRLAGETVGSVNLYGATEDAFEGRHGRLADAVGGWAYAAVTNADLSFATLQAARRAPEVVRNDVLVAQATGILARRVGVPVEVALDRLEDAALRAGIPVHRLARLVVDLADPDRPD